MRGRGVNSDSDGVQGGQRFGCGIWDVGGGGCTESGVEWSKVRL